MNNENTLTFSHNFCESRVNNSELEIFNSYSSLLISLCPLLIGMPKNFFYRCVAHMLIINGFFSFYYHYNLTWFGKHLDESTMLLANYYGIIALLETGVYKYKNQIIIANNLILPILLSVNSIPQNDWLFPHIFSVYVLFTIYLIIDNSKLYCCRKTVLLYLSYSLIGAISWIISEINCNNYTKYGHVIWHWFFPFGFYKIIKLYDTLIS